MKVFGYNIGDQVKVINQKKQYVAYSDWKGIIDKSRFKEYSDLNNGDTGIIVNLKERSDLCDDILALVRIGSQDYIIDVKGIEVITNTLPKTTNLVDIHNFNWAKEQMKQGHKVRRPNWLDLSYWTLKNGKIVYGIDNTPAEINITQLEANDWEIFKENKTLYQELRFSKRLMPVKLAINEFLDWLFEECPENQNGYLIVKRQGEVKQKAKEIFGSELIK